MSETRQLEKIDTVDLGRFVASNGIVTPGQPLKITTPPEQWSYAATAELSRPPAAEFILMQIQVMVTRGRVGIGCVLDDLSTFVEEVAVSASDHSQTANLTWTRDQKPKHIVVRNMAPGGNVSEVLVYSIDLVSLSSGSRGDTAAPAVLRPMANWSRYYSQHYDSLEERLRQRWFDALPQPTVMPWLHGLKLQLLPKNEMLRAVYISGLYEPNSLMVLSDLLSPGDVFIDVGANIGLFSLFAAPLVGERGMVIAVEASGREFDRLIDNIALNNLMNVRALHFALSDKPGVVELSIADDKHGGHNTLAKNFTYASVEKIRTERVAAETIDQLVGRSKIDRLDLIKMDIEGAELLAIRGARETLQKFRPVLLLEVVEQMLTSGGGSAPELESELLRVGYRFWEIDDATGDRCPIATLSLARSENIVASVKDLPPLGSGKIGSKTIMDRA